MATNGRTLENLAATLLYICIDMVWPFSQSREMAAILGVSYLLQRMLRLYDEEDLKMEEQKGKW